MPPWDKAPVDWMIKKAAVQPVVWPAGNGAWDNATLDTEAPKQTGHRSNGCITTAEDSKSFRQINLTALRLRLLRCATPTAEEATKNSRPGVKARVGIPAGTFCNLARLYGLYW